MWKTARAVAPSVSGTTTCPCRVSFHGKGMGWHHQNLRTASKQRQHEKLTRLRIIGIDKAEGWVRCGAGSRTNGVDFKPGDVFHDRYKVEAPIGRGANAVTYQCIDQKTGQKVAVKVLSLRSLKDWKQLDLFQREAQILQNLDHPGIPAYIDWFEDDTPTDKCFFLVQRLVQGVSIEELVVQGWRVEESEVERVAIQLLEILKYLATRRPPVVHRDVKPSNIIIESGGEERGGNIFLVDFGGVQAAVASEDQFGSTIVGTFGFMAPEQFRGAAQPESDLYGLGGTLVYLLSGRPLSDFPLNRMKVDTSTVPMNYKLRRVVNGLLEPVVEDRLTADEALRILRGEELVHKNFIGGNLFASPNLRGRADSNDYEVAMLQDTPEFGKFSRYCGDIQVTVSRSKSSLVIDIPPAPLGGSLYNGAFAIGWNSFVAFWTISAFASGGIFFALFSLPFWVAGVSLQRQAFKRAFVRERLEITDSNWSLRVRLAPLPWKSTEKDWESDASQTFSGDKRRSLTAEVRETGIVNGERQGHLVLNQGNEQFIVGEGLDLRGQYWLCEIINRHLEASRASMNLPAVNESSSDSIP